MLPGPSEILMILGVALLLFGPKKLPELGKALGESIHNFRKGMKPEETPQQTQVQSQPTTLLAQHSSIPQQNHESPQNPSHLKS